MATIKTKKPVKKLVKAKSGMETKGPGDRLRNLYNKALGRKTSTVSVDYEVDGKNVPFTGTVTEGKRKAIMNVSNPEYGSTKSVDRFNKRGALKSQRIVDRDTSGKKIKVTKNKVDKSGNIQSSVPFQRKKGGAVKSKKK